MKKDVLRQGSRISYRTKNAIYRYLFILPALLILLFSVVYPWFWSFWASMTNWRLTSISAPEFIGLKNYIGILTDDKFLLSLSNSIVFMVASVVAQVVLGLVIALLLNRRFFARKVLMIGILLPYMLTPTMVGLVWKMLLHSNWGVINYYLRTLGMATVPDWLGDPQFTMLTLTVVATWLHTPWVTLMIFAGLQSISDEYIEAAKVDGASSMQILWRITLPMLKQLLVIVILFRMVFSFREFDIIYSLFNSGGPGNAAMLLGVYLYQIFSGSWDIGRASAVSFIMLLITIVLSIPVVMRKKGE